WHAEMHAEGAAGCIQRMNLEELALWQCEIGPARRVLGKCTCGSRRRPAVRRQHVEAVIAAALENANERTVFSGSRRSGVGNGACESQVEQCVKHRDRADRSATRLANKTTAGNGIGLVWKFHGKLLLNCEFGAGEDQVDG